MSKEEKQLAELEMQQVVARQKTSRLDTILDEEFSAGEVDDSDDVRDVTGTPPNDRRGSFTDIAMRSSHVLSDWDTLDVDEEVDDGESLLRPRSGSF